MTLSVFVPDGPGPFPVLWYLSGLTCTSANVAEKGEFRAACSDAGVIFIAPDTSPRGDDVAEMRAMILAKGPAFTSMRPKRHSPATTKCKAILKTNCQRSSHSIFP